MNKTVLNVALLIFVVGFAKVAMAQVEASATTPKNEQAQATIEATADQAEAGEVHQVAPTEQAALANRLAHLEARMAEKEAALSQRIDDLEEAQEEAALSEIATEFEPSLRVFGFFDLTFNKLFPEKGGFFDGMVFSKSSFFMQNLNIYLKSELTPTTFAMVELRYTFGPSGKTEQMAFGDTISYETTDTTVQDPFTSEYYRVGGVKIERVHLTWQPRDWFGITAGRYLTPYGIWNIEHGSPVIIGIRPPFSQTSSRDFVPLSQTGLQAHGTFHMGDKTHLGYGVTLSNGRGPFDEVHDLDENKALGLRLKVAYETAKVQAHIGGYGYLGTYTDVEKRVVSLSPFDGQTNVTEKYREVIGTLDAKVSFAGLRIQGEYIRRLTTFETRPLRNYGDKMTTIAGYPADYVGQSAYGLLAYTLPLRRWIGEIKITPYGLIEYVDLNDTVDSGLGVNYLGGVNVKPSPMVTLKVEGYGVYFPKWHEKEVKAGTAKKKSEQFWGIAAQLAVAF